MSVEIYIAHLLVFSCKDITITWILRNLVTIIMSI